jgi:hypothetical protein
MRSALQPESTHHSLLSKSADLLDRPGSPLLEADTVDLLPHVLALCSSSVFRPIPAGKQGRTNESRAAASIRDTAADIVALLKCSSPNMQAIVGLHQTESTYALVEVDGVFAGDDVGDGAAATLAGGLLCCWGHCLWRVR